MKDNNMIANGLEHLFNLIVVHGTKIIITFIIFIICWKLIKVLKKTLQRLLEKRDVEISLRGFLLSSFEILSKILLLITIMGMLGIEMTSFIAILGAAGLAIGMAMQGTLQNFAGGIIVLVLKPYRVDDFIESGDFIGTVKEIKIFNTILATVDNKIIIIPNSELATKTIINYTKADTRRLDISVGIAYGDSVDKARQIMLDLVKKDGRALEDPKPEVVLADLSDSSVNLTLRVWTKTLDYWDINFKLKEEIYNEFNSQGINIPFPQMQIHVTK